MIDIQGIRVLAQNILTYNEPAKTVPILAWCAGCFIKSHLKKCGVKFPHLFLIGEPGSGKSATLENIIVPIMGNTRIYASSSITPFVMMKEADTSNVIPIYLDEFKPSKMKSKLANLHGIYNHLRDGYDGHKASRGRSDQSQVFYDLFAPIVVSGEESPDESAIRERAIELPFSRKDTLADDREAIFIWWLSNRDLLRCFGRSLLDAALRTTVKEVAGWFDESKKDEQCCNMYMPVAHRRDPG